MSHPALSVVIPTLDRRDLLEFAVGSIRLGPPRYEYDIVVVDAGDSGAGEWAQQAGCLVVLAKGATFAQACNAGAKQSRGDVIVLMNDDVTVDPDTLDRLWAACCPGRYPAVAGCRLRYPEGPAAGLIQHAGIGLDQECNPYPLWQLAPAEHPAVLAEAHPLAVTFALAAIPRRIWDELGGLDEGLVNAYEDLDFCLRVREQGWPVRYLPHATGTHREGQSAGRHAHDGESWQHFHAKWIATGRISGVTGVFPFTVQRGGGQ